MKQKLKGAETGHSLLKRKAEALTKRFRTITQKIDDVSEIDAVSKKKFDLLLVLYQ